MSTNKTEHYGLHAWEPEDDFVRQEFNENFAKLDTALAALAQGMGEKLEIVTGTYTGNDASSQYIELGFRPRFVIVVNQEGLPSVGSNQVGGFFTPNMSYANVPASLGSTGFTVKKIGGSYSMTSSGSTFYYVAFK